jgi:3-phytase
VRARIYTPSVNLRFHLVCIALLAIGLSFVSASSSLAQEPLLRFLGELDIASRSVQFEGAPIGGLSGLTYDAKRDVYYIICDDRGEFAPARFYTAKIDIGTDGIHGVRFIGMTLLDSDMDKPGVQPYQMNESDTEEIVLLPDDTLLVSSERDRANLPWIRRFALDGTMLGELPLPNVFVPASSPGADGRPVQTRGVRSNLAFEAVAYAPNERAIYALNEEALAQDGPITTLSAGTLDRLLRYSVSGEPITPGRQVVYRTDKFFATPVPAGQFADNGISAMVWIRGLLPEFDFLFMEKAFVTGVGNNVNLWGIRVSGADDVSDQAALPRPFDGRLVDRTFLVNMASVGVTPDNLEGMTLGPRLADGRTALLIISDDNFSTTQKNQFLLFEVVPA